MVNPEASPIMKYFTYDHLPAPLAGVSEEFCLLAKYVEVSLPSGAEKSTALRKLLEAKDAAVRTLI